MLNSTGWKLALAGLAAALVLGPAGARPQDCNLDGIPDNSQAPWDNLALPDTQATFAVNIDVLSNDMAQSGYYGGICANLVCEGSCGGAPCNRDTVRIVTGPQHGDANGTINGGTAFHGQVRFTFSESGSYCGDAEYFVYYWQDQCGVQSNTAVAKIPIPCPQSDRAFATGGTDWIRVFDQGTASSLDCSNGLTLECWVKPAALGSVATLISKWGDAGIQDRAYRLSVLADGTIDFSLSSNGINERALQAGALQAGVWKHVACTYDGALMKTYLNGVLVGQRQGSGNLFDSSTDLAIAAKFPNNAGNAVQVLNGSIDRVRVYDFALDGDEIQLKSRIRFLPGANFPIGAPPVSSWEMDLNPDDSFLQNGGIVQGTGAYVDSTDIPSPAYDCNGNRLPDFYEIYWSPALDQDDNGVLDECEMRAYCFGDGSGHACPCGNTGLAGRGCNNSDGTGGSRLTASGVASLGADTLLFTVIGEKPTALSTFWQGNASVGPLIYGDGLRCMGGALKRLRSESAVSGIVQYPDGAETHVAVRSAALGDPLVIGSKRYYQVTYRDPSPNFCPPGTYNISGAIEIWWGP